MNKAYKDYKINGWIIIASQNYNDWEILLDTTDNNISDEFYNNEEIRFDTLKECKEWTKTEESKELKDKYLKISM